MKLIKEEINKQFSSYDLDSINDSNLRWQAIKSVITLCLDKVTPITGIFLLGYIYFTNDLSFYVRYRCCKAENALVLFIKLTLI